MTVVALGPSTYREWRPPPELGRYVQCTWAGAPGGPDAEPVLPDGCIDIIWNGRRLFVAGPDTAPVKDAHEGAFAVGIRFRPGAGPLFLGLPAFTLRDARVDLADIWPTAGGLADRLAARSAAIPSDRHVRPAAAVLEEAVASCLRPGLSLDPVVEEASRRWRQDPASLPVPVLAAATGLTERQLHRRFVQAVGYGPKRLHRILRFQSFLQRAGEGRDGLAQLAAHCGYFDQAHLSRETGVLAGRTPAQLAAARAPMSDSSKTGAAPDG